MLTSLVALLDLGYLHPHGRVTLESSCGSVVDGQGWLELSPQSFFDQDLLLLLLLRA